MPTSEKTYSSIEKLRRFVESRNNVLDYIYKTLNLVEVFVDKEKRSHKIQNFFTEL
jgi:hypothetical protein